MGFDEKYDSNAPNAKVRALLPPDRVWLAFMQRTARSPLSSDPPEMFDMYGSFEARVCSLSPLHRPARADDLLERIETRQQEVILLS